MRTLNLAIAVTCASCFCATSAARAQTQAPGATPASATAPAEPGSAGQPAASVPAPAEAGSTPTTTVEKPKIPSVLLKPSLNAVQQTLSSLKLEKWKRGSVRDEAADNVKEVLHDVSGPLPDLMKAADSGPETVSKALPLSRNVGALYDVLLRVYEASRVAAPAEQVTEIQQALTSLKVARLALDNRIQQTSEDAEKHAGELEVTVQKQAAALHVAASTPPPPVCPPPAPKPAVKPRRKPKPATPATKPQTTTPSTSSTPAPKPTS